MFEVGLMPDKLPDDISRSVGSATRSCGPKKEALTRGLGSCPKNHGIDDIRHSVALQSFARVGRFESH